MRCTCSSVPGNVLVKGWPGPSGHSSEHVLGAMRRWPTFIDLLLKHKQVDPLIRDMVNARPWCVGRNIAGPVRCTICIRQVSRILPVVRMHLRHDFAK